MEAHMVRLVAILLLSARGFQLSLATCAQTIRNREHEWGAGLKYCLESLERLSVVKSTDSSWRTYVRISTCVVVHNCLLFQCQEI